MVYAVVVYGVVEPNVCVALDAVVYPCHVLFVYHVYYRISCPHDVGLLVGLFAEDVKVVAACPALVVLCGAEDKRSYIVVFLYKFIGDVVEKGCLSGSIRAFAPNVIEEDCIGAYTELVHCIELGYHVEAVGLVPLDVVAGVYGPHKINLVALGCLNIFLYLGCLVGRVFYAPFCTVVDVVFRPVYVGVHLLFSEEFEHILAVFLTVGVAIIAFDHASCGYIGVVADGYRVDFGALHYLQECLHAVVCSRFVVAGDDYLFRGDAEIVAFALVGNECSIFFYSLVSLFAYCHLYLFAGFRMLGEQCNCILIGSLYAFYLECNCVVKCFFTSPFDALWDGGYLCFLCCGTGRSYSEKCCEQGSAE